MRPALSSLNLAVAPLEQLLADRAPGVTPPVAAELRAMVERLRELAATGGQRPSTLHREGEYWTLAHASAVLRLRHSKGLLYLATLLAQPEVEVHALALACEEPGERAPGAARLDATAKAAYRDRVIELRDRVALALAHGDHARAERHEAELAALGRELAAGIGLGGRDRRFASAGERARVNVTRNLRAAIARIARGHPALGRHLATGVRTGAFCCYAPDPAAAIQWRVAA